MEVTWLIWQSIMYSSGVTVYTNGFVKTAIINNIFDVSEDI